MGLIRVDRDNRMLELKSGRSHLTKTIFSVVAMQTLCSSAAHSADQIYFLTELSRQNIARNALIIAETTNSYGYCYAAVTKALRPFGINLQGRSAYMAGPILSKDNRFEALSANIQVALNVGDIVVYNATNAHPHGHIAVYEGYGTEASDHIAALTPYAEYEGATIFRLKQDLLGDNANSLVLDDEHIRVAPDFKSKSTSLHAVNSQSVRKLPSFNTLNQRNQSHKALSRFNLSVIRSRVLRFLIQSI